MSVQTDRAARKILSENPEAVDSILLRNQWAQARMHPWYFVRDFTFTQDPHSPQVPFKRFPNKILYRIACELWFRERLIAIPKTRQMMLSWLMSALILWDTMFGTGALDQNVAYSKASYIQSKKEEDADELLKRSKKIYSHLRDLGLDLPEAGLPQMRPGSGMDGLGSFCHAEFTDTGSLIQAMAQGEDVARSKAASFFLWDEAAFQPLAELAYDAIKPTTGVTGKLVLVSTANGKNFFWRKCFDVDKDSGEGPEPAIDSRAHQRRTLGKIEPDSVEERALLDMPQDEFSQIPMAELASAVDGLTYWQNKDNGFHILRIHYSADPDKNPKTPRGKEWVVNERKGVDRSTWEREYEINFDTWSGRAVIDNWRRDWFVNDALEYDPDLPIDIACDLGTEVAVAAFAQKTFVQGVIQVRILAEVYLTRKQGLKPNTMVLGDRMQTLMQSSFKESWESGSHRCYPDPFDATKSRSTSEDTDEEILRKYGFKTKIKRHEIAKSTRYAQMQFNYNRGIPGVVFHPRCRYLIGCAEGGWHFPENCLDGKPEVDGIWIHGGDTIRILLNNMVNTNELTRAEQKKTRRARIIRDVTGRRRAVIARRRQAWP